MNAHPKIIDALNGGTPFFSMEFFPPREAAARPEFFAAVDALRAVNPLFVSVTYGAGGGTRATTLEIASRLAGLGLITMTHLTCVSATPESIRDYLAELADAGVRNILALRGDPPQDREMRWEDCAFTYASDMVRFVRREYPDFGIAVAAYLTPHPESPSFAEDRRHTALKLEAGSDFAVTQLFFDSREYFEYVERMRDLGIHKPIVPGVLPVQSLELLRRVLRLSGCNIPAKLYLALEEADRKGGAQKVKEAGAAHAVEQIRTLLAGGAPGIHLYTLNKAELCLRIVDEVGPL
ncbi:MAG: methylenetetrahydrofolate reductase [Desulfovibrio sp.]|jgi:methylenetetrahydrofolate reductase (NADPH)|nr:methylenetetrahydrofolate reductase [Desulfovibrio sp.]